MSGTARTVLRSSTNMELPQRYIKLLRIDNSLLITLPYFGTSPAVQITKQRVQIANTPDIKLPVGNNRPCLALGPGGSHAKVPSRRDFAVIVVWTLEVLSTAFSDASPSPLATLLFPSLRSARSEA